MMRSFYVFIFAIFAICISTSVAWFGYVPVECANRVWSVRYNDTEELNLKFQKWIFAYQNLCEGRLAKPSSTSLGRNGIGSTVNTAVADLIWAVKLKQVFRPQGDDWLWADHDKMKCSLSMRTIDCFSQPLTYCSFDNAHFSAPQIEEMHNDLAALPVSAGFDTCSMGGELRKPLQWVLSHFINYFFRYDASVQTEIDQKLALVFNGDSDFSAHSDQKQTRSLSNSHKSEEKYTTVGVHIRGGLPDGGRQPTNESVYMHYVDLVAHAMKLQNKPVKLVFLCSHTQELNIIDAKHMAKSFPRPFRYAVLPHMSTGEGESEYAVRDNVLNNRELVVEFYTDVEILAKVDYFIGTHSNIYLVVAALRIARGVHKHNNQTCFLDTHQNGNPLVCEGDAKAREIWRNPYSGGGFNAVKDTLNWFNPDAEML